MILQSGVYGALPSECAYRSVVILDPGVSTDHSAFLDCWRVAMRSAIASRCGMDVSRIRPRVYIIYAEEEYQRRYGLGASLASPVPDRFYQHEVRPRKRNPKTIHHKTRRYGLAATFAGMEINSHRSAIVAPWRYSKYGDAQPKHDRRPVGILLEPSDKDLMFFHEKEHLWHRFDVMPRLYLGAHTLGRLPPTFMRWLYGFLALTPGGLSYAQEAVKDMEIRAYPVKHSSFLGKGQPKYDFGAAENWDSGGKRMRVPHYAQTILNWAGFQGKSLYVPNDGNRWDTLAEAINAMVYLVLSQSETMVPYDGLLALAGGATVFAPNVAVWRSVESLNRRRVILYPVQHQGNNQCRWSAQDVAAHLKAALKHRKLSWPK